MINQVILVGRLTRDPELRHTSDGRAYTPITLAVTRQYRNANGEIEADFVQCILWRKTAENTVLYCQKGSVLGVTGRIQTRHYENQEGKRVYVTEVVAEHVQFLSKKERAPQHSTRPIQSSSAGVVQGKQQGTGEGFQEPVEPQRSPLVANEGEVLPVESVPR